MIIDILDPKFPGGRQLQVARSMRGLGQDDIAERMGASQSRVSYIERCDAKTMRLHTLARYVEAMGGQLKVSIEFDVPRETSTKGST